MVLIGKHFKQHSQSYYIVPVERAEKIPLKNINCFLSGYLTIFREEKVNQLEFVKSFESVKQLLLFVFRIGLHGHLAFNWKG